MENFCFEILARKSMRAVTFKKTLLAQYDILPTKKEGTKERILGMERSFLMYRGMSQVITVLIPSFGNVSLLRVNTSQLNI